jgi:hypothetical protein
MALDPNVVDLADDAFRRLDVFTNSWPIPTDEETGRFYHVVSALSSAAKDNYRTLRKAFQADEQASMAWSCRNLLELAILTKFALACKSNADELAADRLIDGLRIGTALKKLELYLNPNLQGSAFDALIDRFTRQMQEEGITRTRFLDIRDLATQVGLRDEFETVNKVCSKFVHPTSWNLFTADLGSDRFPDARDVFFASGAQYFAMVYAEIAPHIKGSGANMCEGRNKASGGVTTTRRVPHSKLQGQFGS